MKNFVQEGKYMKCVAPSGGVVAGRAYKFGNLVGVAVETADQGETFILSLEEGVYQFTKVNTTTYSQGALVDWDISNSR